MEFRAKKLLLITNESSPGDAEGQIDGYRRLLANNEISELSVVSHINMSVQDNAFIRIREILINKTFDLVVIWSPSHFPQSESQMTQLLHLLKGTKILYWEGDAWSTGHLRKAITWQMKYWMLSANLVFTTVANPKR